MHQRRTTLLQSALEHEGIPCRDEHLRQGACNFEGCPDRHTHGLVSVHHEAFRVGRPARDAHHRVAHGPPGDALANDGHPPGELQPGHLVLHLWPRVEAHALQQVGTVQGTGHHVDQHLARAGDRLRHAVSGDHRCAHQRLFFSSE